MGRAPSDSETVRGVKRQGSFDRRWLAGIVLLLTAIGLGLPACLSPTLPLPPPSRPDVTAPNAEGRIRISGRINAFSIVLAENARTNDIVGKETGSSGEYSFEMSAEVDDVIEVWEVYKTEQSERLILVVPNGEDSIGAAGSANE